MNETTLKALLEFWHAVNGNAVGFSLDPKHQSWYRLIEPYRPGKKDVVIKQPIKPSTI